MNRKPAAGKISAALEVAKMMDKYSWTRIAPVNLLVLLDGIREMQEEIKLRTRAGRELEDQVRGDRQTMDAAIAAIDDGVIGSARMLLVMAHPAKHQPKDNGAGDADQESSALSG